MIVLDNKGVGMSAGREGNEVIPAEEHIDLNNGAIEDIVIPDDIGTADISPEAPVEDKASGEDIVSF
jgi:hypothetical protein